jgi:hypothetical protein
MNPYLFGLVVGGLLILVDRSFAQKIVGDIVGKKAASAAFNASAAAFKNCGCTARGQAGVEAPTGVNDPPVSAPAVTGAPTAPRTTPFNPEMLHIDPLTALFAGPGQSSGLGNLTTPPGYTIDPLTGLEVPQQFH